MLLSINDYQTVAFLLKKVAQMGVGWGVIKRFFWFSLFSIKCSALDLSATTPQKIIDFLYSVNLSCQCNRPWVI